MTSKGDLILQKLNPNETTFLGIMSGCVEIMLLQPILYCKNAAQQNLKLTLDPRVLYRGLSVSIINMGVATGLQFSFTAKITKAMTKGEVRKLTGAELLMSSFSGGFLSGLVGGPLELVLIQQQRFGGSLAKVPIELIKSYGLPVLTRGMILTSFREGLFCAGYLGMTPLLSRYFNEKHNIKESSAKIYASIIAGLIAAPLSHPFDTLKTGMQGDVQRTKYGSLVETYNAMLKEGGVKRLFNGLFWRTLRMILGIYVINESKLTLAPMFFGSNL